MQFFYETFIVIPSYFDMQKDDLFILLDFIEMFGTVKHNFTVLAFVNLMQHTSTGTSEPVVLRVGIFFFWKDTNQVKQFYT